MSHRLHIAGLPLLVLAAIFASAVAHASPPLSETFTFGGQDVMGSCGTFDIVTDGAGSVRLTTYFDRFGNPVRVVLHGESRGTLTNSVNGNFLVDAPSIADISVDLVAETETRVGTFFNITVPGAGKVYFEAGRLVYDGAGLPVFIAGQQHAPPETMAILCAALR